MLFEATLDPTQRVFRYDSMNTIPLSYVVISAAVQLAKLLVASAAVAVLVSRECCLHGSSRAAVVWFPLKLLSERGVERHPGSIRLSVPEHHLTNSNNSPARIVVSYMFRLLLRSASAILLVLAAYMHTC